MHLPSPLRHLRHLSPWRAVHCSGRGGQEAENGQTQEAAGAVWCQNTAACPGASCAGMPEAGANNARRSSSSGAHELAVVGGVKVHGEAVVEVGALGAALGLVALARRAPAGVVALRLALRGQQGAGRSAQAVRRVARCARASRWQGLLLLPLLLLLAAAAVWGPRGMQAGKRAPQASARSPARRCRQRSCRTRVPRSRHPRPRWGACSAGTCRCPSRTPRSGGGTAARGDGKKGGVGGCLGRQSKGWWEQEALEPQAASCPTEPLPCST